MGRETPASREMESTAPRSFSGSQSISSGIWGGTSRWNGMGGCHSNSGSAIASGWVASGWVASGMVAPLGKIRQD